ncbi:MAG: threonine--tRNA ligase, partial [Planctomycetes bacterium]|nr:threonine--tRNA ligase [Planctomycetota bacterium]
QDDAHIFCTPDQVYGEVAAFCELTQQTYRDFGFHEVIIKLSTKPEVRLGSDEIWDRGEQALADALNRIGVKWELNPGQGAFYGPKIEYNVRDCLGRMWQLGTIQIDYNMPERLGAKYIGEDNQPHTPVMLHRAICGSLERFVGILIEQYAGAFPLWLAPVQAVVASVSEKSAAYANSVRDRLAAAGLRVEADNTAEKIGPKKHAARKQKVPYILVVGEQEAAAGTVNVNDRAGRTLGTEEVEAFIARCRQEIETKAIDPAGA